MRQWRSSVGSDIGVPKEAKTFSNGTVLATGWNLGQFIMQFGFASPITYDVKCLVIVLIVTSLIRLCLVFLPFRLLSKSDERLSWIAKVTEISTLL